MLTGILLGALQLRLAQAVQPALRNNAVAAAVAPLAEQPSVTLFRCSADVSPGETLLCALGEGGGGSLLGATHFAHNLTLRLIAVASGATVDVPATVRTVTEELLRQTGWLKLLAVMGRLLGEMPHC